MNSYKFHKINKKQESMFLVVSAENLEEAKEIAENINEEYEFEAEISVVGINKL